MGLAASQARFLAITARKADCEFRSMQIAQNKLSVTREMAEISQNYQNALNQTKLVFDYDGSGDAVYDLSYGVLMTPTALNNFSPYLVTAKNGAVVLNSNYAAAAAEAISRDGSPAARSAEGFAAFMDALGAMAIVPASNVDAIKNISNTTYKDASGNIVVNPADITGLTLDHLGQYDKNAGYGGELLQKNVANLNNIIGLAYQMKNYSIGEAFANTNFSDDKGAHNAFKLSYNRNMNSGMASRLTVADLLQNDVTFILTGTNETNKQTFNDTVEDVLNRIHQSFAQVLGVDSSSRNALETAKFLVKNNILNNTQTYGASNWWKSFWSSSASADTGVDTSISGAEQLNAKAFVAVSRFDENNDSLAISLSNMVASYLTFMELTMNGYKSAYSVANTTSASYYVTDDPNYNYLTKNKSGTDNATVMKADFYMQLYNNICINGWTENNRVMDNKYLEQMLKNGSYFMNSLGQDGYFYQGRYNDTDCIVEIRDDDAIAQAEAEFTTMKAKLTYKEEKLDLDMKNLDAEISSLSTEYDSVKNLISKNVEKVFTLFQ